MLLTLVTEVPGSWVLDFEAPRHDHPLEGSAADCAAVAPGKLLRLRRLFELFPDPRGIRASSRRRSSSGKDGQNPGVRGGLRLEYTDVKASSSLCRRSGEGGHAVRFLLTSHKLRSES